MTNTELLQAIRSEVERIMRETGGSQFDIGKRCGMKDILSFLSILEEKIGKTNPLFEECVAKVDPKTREEVRENIDKALDKDDAYILAHETELNSLAFLTELGYTCIPPSEKVSEDLRAVAVEIADKLNAEPKDYAIAAMADYWNGVYDGVFAGANWQKEQMLQGAVEGEVVKDISNKLAVTAKINLDGFKFGQKVKLIILPSDK